jgi:hypothetical protein
MGPVEGGWFLLLHALLLHVSALCTLKVTLLALNPHLSAVHSHDLTLLSHSLMLPLLRSLHQGHSLARLTRAQVDQFMTLVATQLTLR